MLKQIEELQKQVEILKGEIREIKKQSRTKLPTNLKIGDTFQLVDLKWTILDITDKGYICLADRLNEKRIFDFSSNNWRFSDLRAYLNNDFLDKIQREVGEENIIIFNRDLISVDGQTEYGECRDMVSLLTLDEYKKYRKFIPNTNEYFWWLITPWSTNCNHFKKAFTKIEPTGTIVKEYAELASEVRPVCMFSSVIFGDEN